MRQAQRRSANDNVSAYMLANFRHMFAFEDWWMVSKDRFEWKPVEAAARLRFTIDALADGVLLRDSEIWMLGCWDRGGWARLRRVRHGQSATGSQLSGLSPISTRS